jgi:hypothetical protein
MIWFKLKLPLAEEEDEEGCVLVFGNKQVCFEAVKKKSKLKSCPRTRVVYCFSDKKKGGAKTI